MIGRERLDLVRSGSTCSATSRPRRLDAVASALGVAVPPEFLDAVPAELRIEQLERDPAELPWLVRAIVLRAERRVVGSAGFHAPPDERGRVELGYEIVAGDRRRGFAREAVVALMAWAVAHGEVRAFVASIAPGNAASQGLVTSLGFVRVGEQMIRSMGWSGFLSCLPAVHAPHRGDALALAPALTPRTARYTSIDVPRLPLRRPSPGTDGGRVRAQRRPRLRRRARPVVEALRGHAQAGRLTADELDQRVGAALAAKTRGDLATLLGDLPGAPARTRRGRRARTALPRPSFLPIVLVLIAIWAITGAGYFWPIWPLLWFGFFAFARGGSHFRVTSHTRRTW